MPAGLPKDEPLRSQEAFTAYCQLTPEQHEKPLECYALLGARYQAPVKLVESWAKKYKWSDRRRQFEQTVMQKVQERVVENAVETKLYFHDKLTTLIRLWFTTRMAAENSSATINAMRPGDIRALIELDLDIMGGKDISDALKGVKEDDKDAKAAVKVLTTKELQSLVAIGDQDRAKNQPVALPSAGPTGTGNA